MFFSSGPMNVLSGLTEDGSVQLTYTYGRGNEGTFTLDKLTLQLDLLQKMLDEMVGGEQTLRFKINPRPAKGEPFTTGNPTLDEMAGHALMFIEGACKVPETRLWVEKRRREHKLIIPRATMHISAVHYSEPMGEFARATNLAISTKGTVTFERIDAC